MQKVTGADQPVPIWSEEGFSVVHKEIAKPMLYSFIFRLKVGLSWFERFQSFNLLLYLLQQFSRMI